MTQYIPWARPTVTARPPQLQEIPLTQYDIGLLLRALRERTQELEKDLSIFTTQLDRLPAADPTTAAERKECEAAVSFYWLYHEQYRELLERLEGVESLKAYKTVATGGSDQ